MGSRTILKNLRCPSCTKVGRDSTGNHLMVFDDGDHLCNRCGFFIKRGKVLNRGHFEEGEEIPTLESIAGEADEAPATTKITFGPAVDVSNSGNGSGHIKTIKDVQALATGESDRGISGKIMTKFGVRFSFDPSDRSIAKHYYPVTSGGKLCNYKWKDTETKQFGFLIKSQKKLDLFGMMAYTKKKGMNLLITEGELDAMAAYQMLEGHVVDLMVLSLPAGANIKSLSDNIDFIKDQTSVTVAYDQDEAGYLNTAKTWGLLPDIRVMEFSEKDANDCLIAKKSAEFLNAYHNAGGFKPRVLASVGNMKVSDVVAPTVWGLSYPWDAMTKMTYGIHLNQIVGIGAAPGAGKTTLVRGIQQHLMYHHKEQIGIFSLEEKPEWTTKQIVGYILNKPIHIPDTIYDQVKAEAIMADLADKAFFYENAYYTGKWQEIEDMIRYLHIAKGVRFFFIDPLSSLVSHLTPSEANKYLSEALYNLSKLVQQLDITVFHVNHLNTAADGKSHEAGARVYSSQFTGSRAQWRYSHALFGGERNQLATDGTEHDFTVRFLKDRAFGNTGATCTLVYNKTTGRLEDKTVKF